MPRLVRGAIHGLNPLDPLANQIIHTEEFSRLHHIKQLSGVHYVYPGATHTRFAHSLGVYWITRKWMEYFKRSSDPKLYPITDRDIVLVSLAGLMHDIGHCTMGHDFDHFVMTHLVATCKDAKTKSLLKQVSSHEQRSCRLIRHLVHTHKLDLSSEEVDFICNLIVDEHRPEDPKKGWMWEVVSNSVSFLDTDKLDYLLRDHARVGLGRPFNLEDFLFYASLRDGHIVYNVKLKDRLWNVFRARFDMHLAVYQHSSCLIVNYLLAQMLIHHSGQIKLVEKLISPQCEWTKLIDPLLYTLNLDQTSSAWWKAVYSHEYPPYQVWHNGVCIKDRSLQDGVREPKKIIPFYIGFFPPNQNYFPKIPFWTNGKIVFNQIPDGPKSIKGILKMF